MPLYRKLRLLSAALFLLAVGFLQLAPASAGVVVIRNRTTAKVDFIVGGADGKVSRHSLQPNELVPIPVDGEVVLAFDADGTLRRYKLQANSIHYFLSNGNTLDLRSFPLPNVSPNQRPAAPAKTGKPLAPTCKISVMLLVDDNEPAVQRVWEKRLRQRLAEASEIFERHCRVGFEVVAVGTWVSDDRIIDFEKSLREFELTVKPDPARVAIGFTSQYRMPRGQTHLGGTRGPMHTHVLIREWAQHISHTERLEVLVHELGHFLGAVHSIEADSVMRPKIGDHRSNARAFRIGFDPLNTLVMNLLGEELRAGRKYGFRSLQPQTRVQLRSAYTLFSKLMPSDTSAKNYLAMLNNSWTVRRQPTKHPSSLVAATKTVVEAVGKAAQRNHLPTGPEGPVENTFRLSGDRLTEYYVREAAAAATELPSDLSAKAFLLGLGIALDNSTLLRYNPATSGLCREIESSPQRSQRLRLLGAPTMRGRRDLVQHFTASCALTVVLGSRAAESAGVAKELLDARRKSGFSFVDLSADVAGVTFATHVRDTKIPLASLAKSFTVEGFLPEISGLPEGISWDDFLKHFTSAQDNKFLRQQAVLRQRVLTLPVYRSS